MYVCEVQGEWCMQEEVWYKGRRLEMCVIADVKTSGSRVEE